jgi:hypothetical protein
MADSLSQEIDAQLQRYLRGEDSLAEFEAWLVPETWDISPQSDRSAHDLATAITLRIAEFTNGDWTEEELKRALEQLAQTAPAQITLSGVAKDQEIMNSLGQGSFSVAGRPHSGAFA